MNINLIIFVTQNLDIGMLCPLPCIMFRRKKTDLFKNHSKNSSIAKKWLFIYILAPLLVGVILFYIEFSSKEKYGSLVITSNVDSAIVLLNLKQVGLTKSSQAINIDNLLPGQYLLTVRKDSIYIYKDEKITINEGSISSLSVNYVSSSEGYQQQSLSQIIQPIEENNSRGELISLPVTVPGSAKNARILVDGKWIANAPNTIRLEPGEYLLRVEYENLYYEELIRVPDRKFVNIIDDEFLQK